MSREEGDEAGLITIEQETAKLLPLIEELEFRRMFSKEADPLNCYIDIQAGAGGTEACDWASHAAAPVPEIRRTQRLQSHRG